MLGIRVSTVKFNDNQQSRSQLTPPRPVMVQGKKNKSATRPSRAQEGIHDFSSPEELPMWDSLAQNSLL